MLSKTIKQTSIALATVMTLSLGNIGLSIPAKAAPLHINSIQTSEAAVTGDLIEVRGFSKRRSHSRGIKKGHGYKRSHFKRSQNFRSNKYSRHGSFSRHGTRHNERRHHSFRTNQFPGFILTPKSR